MIPQKESIYLCLVKANQPIINGSIFLLLALTWGSSFILMKLGLRSFNGVEVALLRISLATCFITIVGWRSYRLLKWKDLPAILLVGYFGNGIPYVLFAWALMKVDSSIIGITNSLTPLFTLLVGVLLYKNRMRPLQIIGVLLGLFGAIYLINPGNNAALGDNWIYALLGILASFMYSIGINTISAKLQHLDSISITTFALSIVGIPAAIGLLLFTDFLQIMQTDELAWQSVGYISILGLMGTGLAIVLFNYLIKNASPLFAVSITYLVPIVAIGWGALDNEPITANHAVGIVSILIGVFLINKKRRNQ